MTRALRILPLFILLLPTTALAVDACCLCQRPNDTEKTCLTKAYSGRSETETQACAGLAKATGLAKDGWTCDATPVENCKARPEGTCPSEPINAIQLEKGEIPTPKIGATTETPTPAIIPKLNTPIPEFEFEAPNEGKNSLLAQYLGAAIRYGISITAVAATIMFVWGAFQYLLGSAITSIQNGKTIMMEAILGMIFVFSAVAILRVVNPELTKLSSFNIDPIRAIAINNEDVADKTVRPNPTAPATPSMARGAFQSWSADELTGAEYINAEPGAVTQPLNVPIFKQASGPWANQAFGPPGVKACDGKNNDSFSEAGCCTTYHNAGCGAASLATLAVFNSIETDPKQTGDVLVSIGARTCNQGTSFGKNVGEKLASLTGEKRLTGLGGGMAGVRAAITALRAGQPVMFLCQNCAGKTSSGGTKTYKGHYMVLTGVDPTGRIFTVSDVGNGDPRGIVNIAQNNLAKYGAAFWALQ